MSFSDQEKRNREIAENEARREIVSNLRVSVWAIAAAIIVGVIAFGIVWAWLHRSEQQLALRHRSGLAQRPDCGLVIAGVAEDLVAVLADAGRLARRPADELFRPGEQAAQPRDRGQRS